MLWSLLWILFFVLLGALVVLAVLEAAEIFNERGTAGGWWL